MKTMYRYDTDAIYDLAPGTVKGFDIREGAALVVSHEGEDGLEPGQKWWVSYLKITEAGDSSGVEAEVYYQEEFGHPFDAGIEWHELEGLLPKLAVDPSPPKGTVERKRYDQQMDAAYHELMKDHSQHSQS